jgi:hypothetical protein
MRAYLLQICDYLKWITGDFTHEIKIVEEHKANSIFPNACGTSAREGYEPLIAAILRRAYKRTLLAPIPFRPTFQSFAVLKSNGSKRNDFRYLSVPKLSLLDILWNVDSTLSDRPRSPKLTKHPRAEGIQTRIDRRERFIDVRKSEPRSTQYCFRH